MTMIEVGDKVRTANPLTAYEGGWSRTWRDARRAGTTGVVTKYWATIRPYFMVRHDDGTEAPYDADELIPIAEVKRAMAKPFPMPGTVWRWLGSDVAPPSGPHTVTRLRFGVGAEALFGNGNCGGVEHMMTNDAWEHVESPATDTHKARDDEYRAAWERWSCSPPVDSTAWSCVGAHTQRAMANTVDPLLDRIDAANREAALAVESVKRLVVQAIADAAGLDHYPDLGLLVNVVRASAKANADAAAKLDAMGDVHTDFEIAVHHAAGMPGRAEQNELCAYIARMRTNLESKEDECRVQDEEHERLRTSLSQALDCDPDSIENIAREQRASLDMWYDFRTDVATALECNEEPHAIIAAILDMKESLRSERVTRKATEGAVVIMAKEVERLQQANDMLRGVPIRRSLFSFLREVMS